MGHWKDKRGTHFRNFKPQRLDHIDGCTPCGLPWYGVNPSLPTPGPMRSQCAVKPHVRLLSVIEIATRPSPACCAFVHDCRRAGTSNMEHHGRFAARHTRRRFSPQYGCCSAAAWCCSTLQLNLGTLDTASGRSACVQCGRKGAHHTEEDGIFTEDGTRPSQWDARRMPAHSRSTIVLMDSTPVKSKKDTWWGGRDYSATRTRNTA
jgi:hypothetical protein